MFSKTFSLRHCSAALALGAGLLHGAPAAVAAAETGTPSILKANFLIDSSFVEDDGAAEHMVYAAKLRLLSQRIPAAACFEHFGIEKEINAELLRTGSKYFDRILLGLEFGDAELGLMKPETDPYILKDLRAIHAQWDPIHDLIEKIAAGDSTDAEIVALSTTGAELVRLTGKLSSDVMAEYADPTVLLQADALKLEIAGRMPMMAQRMAKDMCMAVGGLKVDEVLSEMSDTRTLFENTLGALRHGMPALGLTAAEDPELQAALDQAQASWAEIAPAFDALATGTTISKAEETEIYHGMNALTDKLDRIELMFGAMSKLGL